MIVLFIVTLVAVLGARVEAGGLDVGIEAGVDAEAMRNEVPATDRSTIKSPSKRQAGGSARTFLRRDERHGRLGTTQLLYGRSGSAHRACFVDVD